MLSRRFSASVVLDSAEELGGLTLLIGGVTREDDDSGSCEGGAGSPSVRPGATNVGCVKSRGNDIRHIRYICDPITDLESSVYRRMNCNRHSLLATKGKCYRTLIVRYQ